MRTQCCGVMTEGQCTDCPLTAPIRPTLWISSADKVGALERRLAEAEALLLETLQADPCAIGETLRKQIIAFLEARP